MEKTRMSRVRPGLAAAWKRRFAGEGKVKNLKEGKKRVARASLAFRFFHQLFFIAAGVRRPAWGLHHIARPPPPFLVFWGADGARHPDLYIMLPSHIITAIVFARLDLGDTHEQSMPQLIGAATFTGHVANASVTFALDAAVLSAKDTPEALLLWLNHRLEHDRSVITGYDLTADARLLEALPLGRWSPAVRVLSGRRQPLIDLGASSDGEPIGFRACCAALGVPSSAPDPVRDFTAWCTGRHDVIVGALELDVIAVWRLTMMQIAARTSRGADVQRIIDAHLARWLRGADFAAAATHLAALNASALSITPFTTH
ncbi:hypothetical protein U1707_00090 [Sphingomonas sp. PB2P12]|uniref:hypothetical protein n=1 Tax=Sphingomonas sandaracina TaxID=3096157 RepID=UPI002FCA8999